MVGDTVKEKWFVATILAVLLIFFTWTLHHYKEEINLSGISLLKLIKNKKTTENAECSIVQNIGINGLLGIKMVIPCENKEQLSDLEGKMHMIKSDFLINFDQTEIEEWVRHRNFRAIKNELLRIVNHHTDEPVENLYFESFVYK